MLLSVRMELPHGDDMMFALFVQEMLECTDNPVDRLGIVKLTQLYRDWNEKLLPDDQVYRHRYDVLEIMTTLVGPPAKNTMVWVGWRPRQPPSL